MKRFYTIAAIAFAAFAMVACNEESSLTKSGLDPQNFVGEYNGKATALYTLTNENGMEVCLTNFGGRIVSIMAPDKDGVLQDVCLSFDKIEDFFPENNLSDFGATVGRYANRIANGQMTIDGTEYQLSQNNNGHCLHGGATGWQYQVYDVVELDEKHIKFEIISPDGDNGFPGNVTAWATYRLTEDNAIDCVYEAETDQETVINMTNHTYFNLSGDPANHDVCGDILWVNAENYTPAGATLIPTGEIAPVAGTPFDFTEAKGIGKDINADNEQLKNANGYDHNWVLDNEGSDEIPVVDIVCPASCIELVVYTNEPGIQIYGGNFLDGTVVGKHGIAYGFRTGICFESQKYPNTPNQPEWPSATLRPGEHYYSHCVYAFSVSDLGLVEYEDIEGEVEGEE